MCIDAPQLVPDKNGLLREVARVLRPDGRVVITTWERRGGEPADLPPEHSIAARRGRRAGHTRARRMRGLAGAAAGVFRQVIAEDSDQAEPALRLLAEDGRSRLPYGASVRRLFLVAGP